jgi:hypothetical protein
LVDGTVQGAADGLLAGGRDLGVQPFMDEVAGGDFFWENRPMEAEKDGFGEG